MVKKKICTPCKKQHTMQQGTWTSARHVTLTLVCAFVLARGLSYVMPHAGWSVALALLLTKCILGDWDVETWAWTPIDLLYWASLGAAAVAAVYLPR